jgi:hypothetical protein
MKETLRTAHAEWQDTGNVQNTQEEFFEKSYSSW